MKNPGVSAVLSFFCPGLGHIYNGQIGWGIAFLIAFIICIGSCFIFIGFILAPAVWLFAMFSAYNDAKRINQQEENKTIKCPFCAEIIKADAIVCRFCGKDLPKDQQSLTAQFAKNANAIKDDNEN